MLFTLPKIKDAIRYIPEDDILSRQRYILFRIFTVIGILIFLIFSAEEYSFNELNSYRIFIFMASTSTLIINYVGLQFHRDFKLSYAISIIAGFILIHCSTYYSGGIRNPDFLYFGSIILYAYIVLENKGGKITLYTALLNIAFFYYLSDFTAPGDYISHSLEGRALDMRHLITALTSMTLITALSSYLENAKNAVITKIEESKIDLELKNESLKELSLVAKETENSVIITNASGIIEWVNEGFTRLTGYTFEESIGQKQQDLLFGALTQPEAADALTNLRTIRDTINIEIIKYTAGGEPIWVNENITRVKDDSDNKIKIIFMESDITERKASEKKMKEYLTNLEKRNQELDKFAYVVSHDLKAPLRAIGNLTGWIEEDSAHLLPAEVLNNFNTIKQRVVRMEALINGILAYSKAAKNVNPHEHTDTIELVKETAELYSLQQGVRFNIKGKLPVVFCDKVKLQQVFQNLIDNAIKFNSKKIKKVEVSCTKSENQFHFIIADNGPGIDARFHEKIFVIFQTIESKDDFETTGVGLAIVKKILEEIGGSIWVKSENGKGTQIHFTIPEAPQNLQSNAVSNVTIHGEDA